MKLHTVTTLVLVGALAASSAWADHNSHFGDNTGRTMGGVHDNRFESNTKSADNRDTMGQGRFQVQGQGGFGGYQQGGAPATVVPGNAAPTHGGGRR
jgi:hypothetical protein